MKSFFKDVKYILSSNKGGPSVEALIGIAVAMAVGTGLFILGSSIIGWNKSASKTIDYIEIAWTPES